MGKTSPIGNGTACKTRSCRVCGAPVRPSRGTRPTEYCSARPCAEVAKFRAALEDRLGRVSWGDGDAAIRARFRSELQRLVNQVPCDWQRPRNELGRWMPDV